MFLGVSRIGGKTNLIRRLIFGRIFEENLESSGTYALNKITTPLGKVKLWDTAGQERYRPINKIDYKDCDCFLIEYDVTVKDSFDNDIKD